MKQTYTANDLNKWYGSRDNILKLWSDGSLPDPYWDAQDIEYDLACRERREEPLPAKIEEMRSIYGLTEPQDD